MHAKLGTIVDRVAVWCLFMVPVATLPIHKFEPVWQNYRHFLIQT